MRMQIDVTVHRTCELADGLCVGHARAFDDCVLIRERMESLGKEIVRKRKIVRNSTCYLVGRRKNLV